MVDVSMFLAGFFAGLLLIFTYTSIGLSLPVAQPDASFLEIGFKRHRLSPSSLASIVENLFEREILYLISPYDCVAHVGQALIGT